MKATPEDIDDIFYHDLPENDEDTNGEVHCLLPKEEQDPDEEDPDDPEEPDVPEGPDVPELPPAIPPLEPPPIIPPQFMPNPHPWSKPKTTVPFEIPIPAGLTATVPFETPVAIQPAQADFCKNKKPGCYNSGFKADRSPVLEAVDALCSYVGQALTEANKQGLGSGLYQIDRNFKVPGQAYTDYVTTFEIKDFCEWKHYGRVDCSNEFRKIVDGCNTKSENGKQGGIMDGNCVKWRVDPNKETA